MPRHQQTLGILAGMGPRSTAPFVETVVDQCQRLYGAKYDNDFPRMMVLSLPTPFYIDRPVDHQKMKEVIVGGLKQLEHSGVQLIAMPCNSAHIYFKELVDEIDTPLLNMIDEVTPYLMKDKKTTLVSTRTTWNSNLYQAKFGSVHIEFYFDFAWQGCIDSIISHIKLGKVEVAVERWKALLCLFESVGIEQVVIACTDLNVILGSVSTTVRFIDSGEALAQALVKRYMKSCIVD